MVVVSVVNIGGGGLHLWLLLLRCSCNGGEMEMGKADRKEKDGRRGGRDGIRKGAC